VSGPPSDAQIRLLLVEDMPQVAQYIRGLLDTQTRIKLLDVVTDGRTVIEQVREHYKIDIEVVSPDYTKLEPFVKEKGLFSFYKDGHGECCGIRKIEPLRRKLSGVTAWATGQRRDQSPGTRSAVAVLEIDTAFSTPERTLYKFNPLAQMTSEEIWGYIRMLELPYNSLHERGFISIGCEPCTRPVLPNQHEREGRWWWEEATQKECGLHAGNIISKSKE